MCVANVFPRAGPAGQHADGLAQREIQKRLLRGGEQPPTLLRRRRLQPTTHARHVRHASGLVKTTRDIRRHGRLRVVKHGREHPGRRPRRRPRSPRSPRSPEVRADDIPALEEEIRGLLERARRKRAACLGPTMRATPSVSRSNGRYECPSLRASDCSVCSIAAANRARDRPGLSRGAPRARRTDETSRRERRRARRGSARTRDSVAAPCAAATLCASAGAMPCFSRKAVASRLPRDWSHALLSFAAVLAPTPGHSRSAASASGRPPPERLEHPRAEMRDEFTRGDFSDAGKDAPGEVAQHRVFILGGNLRGVALRTNCVPHFSTSRQSPDMRRFWPSAAEGTCPTTVTIASLVLPFFALRCLYAGRPVRVAVAPIGSASRCELATRTRATVYPLSGLWKVTRRISPTRHAPASGATRAVGGAGRRGSGERSRSLVRAPELERGSGGVRGAWAWGTRAASEAARGGRRGPGPGASARRRSFAPRRGARRRGGEPRGGPGVESRDVAARAGSKAWFGSGRAPDAAATGGAARGLLRRGERGKGARRGTRARRARRRAASAPRIAPEGRRDADAWDASREVTQAAVDSCAVAEPPSM